MSPTASPILRPAPMPRASRLWLTIGATPYALRPLGGESRRGFRLQKGDGTLYDVALRRFGPACDCPDFVFRRDGLDPEGCKHIKALVECGLIVRTEPAARVG